jgi:hypothetical protein
MLKATTAANSANACRKLARYLPNPEIQRQLLDMAEMWDAMEREDTILSRRIAFSPRRPETDPAEQPPKAPRRPVRGPATRPIRPVPG